MWLVLVFAACTGPVPTWSRDVAPIVADNCAQCHRPGGIGPFSLLTYEDAAARAQGIADATADRSMPPFNPDNGGECNTYVDARWLTDHEIATFAAWADGGAPEGEPGPPLEVPPAWQLDRVDATVEMPEPYTPNAAAEDDYRCFLIDPQLAEDRFVTGYEPRLGEPRMVHHLTLFALDTAEAEQEAEALDAAEPGPGYTCFGDPGVDARWLIGTGPGSGGSLFPDGTGLRARAGRKLVLQMHYNTRNGVFTDQTAIDVRLDAQVKHEAVEERVAATELHLPPGEEAVKRSYWVDLSRRYTLWGVWPHMHNLGTRLRATVIHPDGSHECLTRVPHYEFHWQGFAFYEKPIHVRRGDKLRVTCTFDTRGRQDVTHWGSGTDDEMCIAFFYVTEED